MITAHDNTLNSFLSSAQSLKKFSFSRWEELHALASEPMESHVFFAEHFYDAVNGLYTTLSTFSVCNATPEGGSPQQHWRQLLLHIIH